MYVMSVTHALLRCVTVNSRFSRFGNRTDGLPTAIRRVR